MANDRAYIVTYVGDGVVNLPRVGIFQAGTRAWVDAEMAELARRHGHFVVTGPDGLSAPVVDEMPPPPPAPNAAAPPAPIAAAPPAPIAAASPAPIAAAPAAPPAARPRKTRTSVVLTVVPPSDEK
ncbi:MAG TPA: hypothetical protein VKE22_23200 [Haliangiales bacterium]|nr:hypothetical protein [Haliangiales bacterium]